MFDNNNIIKSIVHALTNSEPQLVASYLSIFSSKTIMTNSTPHATKTELQTTFSWMPASNKPKISIATYCE